MTHPNSDENEHVILQFVFNNIILLSCFFFFFLKILKLLLVKVRDDWSEYIDIISSRHLEVNLHYSSFEYMYNDDVKCQKRLIEK